jgi:hypothetical protein
MRLWVLCRTKQAQTRAQPNKTMDTCPNCGGIPLGENEAGIPGQCRCHAAKDQPEARRSAADCSKVPNAVRKADGWAPAIDYENGGRIIGCLRFGTKESAKRESSKMIGCMELHPGAFANDHPGPNQLIDLSNAGAVAPPPQMPDSTNDAPGG